MTIPGSNNRPNFPQCNAELKFEELHETARLTPFTNEEVIVKHVLTGSCEEVSQLVRNMLDDIKNYPEDTSHRKTIKEASGKVEIQFVPGKIETYTMLSAPDQPTTSWTQRETILSRSQHLFSTACAYMASNKALRIINPLADRNNSYQKGDPFDQRIFVSRKADVKLPKS